MEMLQAEIKNFRPFAVEGEMNLSGISHSSISNYSIKTENNYSINIEELFKDYPQLILKFMN